VEVASTGVRTDLFSVVVVVVCEAGRSSTVVQAERYAKTAVAARHGMMSFFIIFIALADYLSVVVVDSTAVCATSVGWAVVSLTPRMVALPILRIMFVIWVI
jgi:hypothetical protein